MHIDNISFEQALERDARRFLGLDAGDGRAGRSPQRIIVADFEYRWDRSRYDGYRVSEGESAEPTIRWPFHRMAAASWLQLRFDPGEEVPAVESVVVLAEDEASEQEMIARFFEALHQVPTAQLITWGGEVKDLAVLRRSAGEFALVLPRQLTDGSPPCPSAWLFSRCNFRLCHTSHSHPSASARSSSPGGGETKRHSPPLLTAMGLATSRVACARKSAGCSPPTPPR